MMIDALASSVLLVVVQLAFVVCGAPLLHGITRRVKARLQYRRGPSVWQSYRDLRKWWGKSPVESDTASALTAAAPVIVLAAMITAVLLVPIVALRPPLDRTGDLLVVVGLLALARFVLALAALDAGSAESGTTNLAQIATQGAQAGPAMFTPALLLAATAFGIVAIAETGHEPVDNPDTHLELTMIHEGMLLEASGRRLALLMYASHLKLVVVVGLFAAVFLPFGAASDVTVAALSVGVAVAFLKLAAAAGLLGLLDAGTAKLRILALPGLLGLSSLLALTALAIRLWLPA